MIMTRYGSCSMCGYYLQIVLFFPADEGIPGLSIGSSISINIRPSDDAFGVFSFDSNSLSRVVEETEGGTPVVLTVIRSGGTFDSISVYWEVEGPEGDVTPTRGVVEFAEGQTEGELTITVTNDQVGKFAMKVYHVFEIQEPVPLNC